MGGVLYTGLYCGWNGTTLIMTWSCRGTRSDFLPTRRAKAGRSIVERLEVLHHNNDFTKNLKIYRIGNFGMFSHHATVLQRPKQWLLQNPLYDCPAFS